MCIRPVRASDASAVARIDAYHTGRSKPQHWKKVLSEPVLSSDPTLRVALAAEADGRLVGYLLGEIRAFEFGSEPCGWILVIAVHPDALRHGVGSALLKAGCDRFREAGVTRIRTMVRRNDIPVLAFFRTNGLAGGSYVQLEKNLDEPVS